jgi:hypothetical protein
MMFVYPEAMNAVTDTDEDADHRDDPAHPQVIDVGPVLDEVRPATGHR